MTQSDATRQARWTRAVSALLHNTKIEDAASEADIDRRTLQRWLSSSSFQVMLHDAQDNAMELAARRLAGLSGSAVNVLDQVMSDEGAPQGVRTRAADLALTNALRFQDAVHLARRVQALERTQLPGSKDKVNDEATSD